MSRFTAIICAVIILLLASMAWAVNHYRDSAISYKDQRDKATEQLILANATITDMQTRQRDVAALDAKYTKELADAQNTISDLRRDVDSGAKRLRVAATCTGRPAVQKISSDRRSETSMNGLQLIATGGALPGRTVTNEELSRTVDTSDEWITTRTGIRARHWCTEEESAATLAIAAAKQALERSGLSPQDIACCVCATLSAPDATPSVACQVQRALSLPENRPALDVNAACSGFIYGTAVARGLMATLGGRYALVVGCEALSRLMDQTDRSTCVLFGDGAGAAIFELCDAPFAITLGARGDEAIHAGGPCCTGSAPISMDGRAVFRFAVDALPRCLHAVLDETQLALDDVDWVVCHQANSRIIDHCVKALHADAAKFYKNMDRHGNTSAASIPVALNEMAEAGLLKAGQKVSCIGFGGGLTWGGMLVTYSPLSHG